MTSREDSPLLTATDCPEIIKSDDEVEGETETEAESSDVFQSETEHDEDSSNEIEILEELKEQENPIFIIEYYSDEIEDPISGTKTTKQNQLINSIHEDLCTSQLQASCLQNCTRYLDLYFCKII
jgi:endo-alpha-1,4-polygalactosaminidase (GH114 family)